MFCVQPNLSSLQDKQHCRKQFHEADMLQTSDSLRQLPETAATKLDKADVYKV